MSSTSQPTASRLAFTLAEMVMAMAVLAVLMLLTVQIATWSMRERLRLAARHAALEHATNILEAARAVPATALTPEWAAGHQGTPPDSALPPQTRVEVAVSAEKDTPAARRVVVSVYWRLHEDEPEQVVQLMSIFGPQLHPGGKR